MRRRSVAEGVMIPFFKTRIFEQPCNLAVIRAPRNCHGYESAHRLRRPAMLSAATEIVAVMGVPKKPTHRFQEVKDSTKRGLPGPLHIALALGVVAIQRHNLPDLV